LTGSCSTLPNDLFASEDEPTLVGMFGDNTQVEAFVKPTQVSVRVDGKWLVGEQAYAVASDLALRLTVEATSRQPRPGPDSPEKALAGPVYFAGQGISVHTSFGSWYLAVMSVCLALPV